MKNIKEVALFRLSVLGQLASRDHLNKGELKLIIKDIAAKTYNIPNSEHNRLSISTIERWYYAWKRGGILALDPVERSDRGKSCLSTEIQEAILNTKQAKPSRSINRIIQILEMSKIVSQAQLTRSSVYRILKSHSMSLRIIKIPENIERRSFVAEHAGQLWQGDVLHGPHIAIDGKLRKTYLVSFMDDASRLIVHSEFRLGETSLDIQAVLRQALLKRGIPNRIILDNGSAYRSAHFKGVCARLQINLVFCAPYTPQGKGKIERWHSRFRSEFLEELLLENIKSLPDLNSRLWAYLDQMYHVTTHEGLADNMTPQQRWRQDIAHVRQLGLIALQLDEIFYHRESRKVRNDACVSLHGQWFEVPYELTGSQVIIVFDAETNQGKWVESLDGKKLGDVTLLDQVKNSHRQRQKPPKEKTAERTSNSPLSNPIEQAYAQQQENLLIKESEKL